MFTGKMQPPPNAAVYCLPLRQGFSVASEDTISAQILHCSHVFLSQKHTVVELEGLLQS